ncbi:MAG: putative phosphodiesterase, partial [Bacteriovoracaceae bacterium]
MKIAILSDIHGNFEALNEVLNDVDAQGITTLLVLGDLVGYYYQHKECFERLNSSKYQIHIIRGNHEDLFEQTIVDQKKAQFYIDKYGHSLELAKRDLNDSEKKWLFAAPKSLTLELEGRKILLCHGAPWDTDQYV